MSVFDQEYLTDRISELDAEIRRQQQVFMEAQQQVLQLSGARQALSQLLHELRMAEAKPVSEEDLMGQLRAESIEFIEEKEDA